MCVVCVCVCVCVNLSFSPLPPSLPRSLPTEEESKLEKCTEDDIVERIQENGKIMISTTTHIKELAREVRTCTLYMPASAEPHAYMIKINEPQLPWLRTAIYHTQA